MYNAQPLLTRNWNLTHNGFPVTEAAAHILWLLIALPLSGKNGVPLGKFSGGIEERYLQY